MASNPHSDFTTHIHTLPTLSNLQLSPHVQDKPCLLNQDLLTTKGSGLALMSIVTDLQ